MDADLKKILKAVVLEMRHELEGYYDSANEWHPGDLENRLAEIGVRKDRESVPVDELQRLTDEDKHARRIVDAYLKVRDEAGEDRSDSLAEFVRESAYTWANRLIALRCMEARELIDEAILQKDVYGGRSLEHNRLAQRDPDSCSGEDDGLFAMLEKVFAEQSEPLPMLFDSESPGIALRPSPPAIKNCIAWLSGTTKIRSVAAATDEVFSAPDALGWAYQYWNTEEKDRVFETVRTKKGAKIEGADIIPATQLYTEDYMVKFLVQNSLGATWMGMHPDSKLFENWEYYVRDADRADVTAKPLSEITLLDPACGSGHFLLEAFNMLYDMYEEAGEITDPEEICKSILTNNLFGIDIDARAIQIAEAALWMKAEERSMGFGGGSTNLVAATSSHLRGPSWEKFLGTLKNEPSTVRVLRKFATEIEHIDELGSLARPGEALEEIIKEEHAVWERQERERRDAPSLFKEIRDDILASQLPFQDISDEEFQSRTMRHALFAIDGFTRDARESGDFNDQLIGAEAKSGFRLLEMLSRKYDVVVANPPYMGSNNMGPVLKQFVDDEYKLGKRDIYTAFILRSLELTHGRVAMVTQQSWMFLKSFSDLRAVEDVGAANTQHSCFSGVFRETSVESLAHLGTNAFTEISGEVVNSAMFVLVTKARKEHKIHAIRLLGFENAKAKAAALIGASRSTESPLRYSVAQNLLTELPLAPLVYWIPPRVATLLQGRLACDVADVVKGLDSGQDSRFVRFVFEVSGNGWRRWALLEKGGGYGKWFGHQHWVIDWREKGSAVRAHKGSTIRNERFFFREGWTYSFMARGALGLRSTQNSIFAGGAACGVFPKEQNVPIAALIGNRFGSYIVRSISGKIQLNESYVGRVPVPEHWADWLIDAERLAVALAKLEAETDLTEFTSKGYIGGTKLLDVAVQKLKVAAYLLTLDSAIETEVFSNLGLAESDVAAVYSETGQHSGRLPLIVSLDTLPELPSRIRETVPNEFTTAFEELTRKELSAPDIDSLKVKIRTLYETGSPATSLDDDTSDSLESEMDNSGIPIPFENDLERIAQSVGYHPVSVYWILRNGIEHDHWQSSSVAECALKNQYSLIILSALGYVWPNLDPEKEIYDAVDDDGIIPLIEISKEPSLQSRVAKRIRKDESIVVDFTDNVGKPENVWLTNDFFKHHIMQFKRRPIAWQLQTSSFTSRNQPAFGCLVYYHKIELDLLPKIRSQYLGPLRTGFDTELRGITNLKSENRTDKQNERLARLEDWSVELQDFDSALESIARKGFGPDGLIPKLRQYAFDDAMLSLKARWLKRLSELVESSDLADWVKQADDSALHPELSSWISDSLSHLDYFCALVGPKAPVAKKTETDPVTKDLADLIHPKAKSMMAESVKLACDVWWNKLNESVFKPLKTEIKELKAEQKELNSQIKSDEPVPQDEFYRMKDRVKVIKAELKELNADLKKKTAAAQKLRKQIEGWTSDEPAKWSDWLAKQPLFDQVSSLDDRRSPPTTIAEFIAQESMYAPDINDGVRVNIAPLQKAGILAADVLAARDVDKAIADRAEWRADERRWVREGKLPQCGWWPEEITKPTQAVAAIEERIAFQKPVQYTAQVLIAAAQHSSGQIELGKLLQTYTLLCDTDRIVQSAPEELSDKVTKWLKDYPEQPKPEFFREVLLDLVSREQVDASQLQDGLVALDSSALDFNVDPWVLADVQLVSEVIESMTDDSRDLILSNEQQTELKLLLAG